MIGERDLRSCFCWCTCHWSVGHWQPIVHGSWLWRHVPWCSMCINVPRMIINLLPGAQEYYVKEIRLPSPEALQHRELPRFVDLSWFVKGQSCGQRMSTLCAAWMASYGQLYAKERCRRRSESLDLPIERGVSFGQRLLFEMQADQRPQHVPGDPWRRYSSKAWQTISRCSMVFINFSWTTLWESDKNASWEQKQSSTDACHFVSLCPWNRTAIRICWWRCTSAEFQALSKHKLGYSRSNQGSAWKCCEAEMIRNDWKIPKESRSGQAK